MRRVTVAAIQPPYPRPELGVTTARMIDKGLRLVEEAGGRGANAAVLPECFNTLGLSRDEALAAAADTSGICERAADIARRYGMLVVLPLIVKRGERCLNRTLILGRAGAEIGHYDKVHLTITERRDYGLTAGDAIPTFETEIGVVGIMVCYDVYFPEISRILGVKGAEILFFPTLQRSERREVCEMQVRLRAMDSFAHVVRSSYGAPTMPAPSCIVCPDGDIIADAGHGEGFVIATIDLDERWRRPRCHGEPAAVVRDFILEDRRPKLYRDLTGRT